MKFDSSLSDVIPRATDTFSYRFPRPAEFEFKAGQYMLVTVKSGDKELMHPFSISSSPTERGFLEFTKKLTASEYSTQLRSMKAGDWARIDGPYGKFTYEGEYHKILQLAGGIGITPFISVIQNWAAKHLQTSIVLLYGSRSEKDFAFKDELDKIQAKNPNLSIVYVAAESSPTWTGQVGFITADLVKQLVPDYKDRIFYACGPPVMVTVMQKIVNTLGLPETQLKIEALAGHT